MAGPWRIVQRNSKSEGEFASNSRTPKILVETGLRRPPAYIVPSAREAICVAPFGVLI